MTPREDLRFPRAFLPSSRACILSPCNLPSHRQMEYFLKIWGLSGLSEQLTERLKGISTKQCVTSWSNEVWQLSSYLSDPTKELRIPLIETNYIPLDIVSTFRKSNKTHKWLTGRVVPTLCHLIQSLNAMWQPSQPTLVWRSLCVCAHGCACVCVLSVFQKRKRRGMSPPLVWKKMKCTYL